MNHMGTGGLQSFKVNVTPSSLIMNAFLHDKKRQSADNASNIVCAGNVYLLQRLRKRAYLLQNLTRKMITRTRTFKVNKPTVEGTF